MYDQAKRLNKCDRNVVVVYTVFEMLTLEFDFGDEIAVSWYCVET